tara:strand:- start:302 stop:661 length:360 start_codon:yes stop_codon:yes gene_type:complete
MDRELNWIWFQVVWSLLLATIALAFFIAAYKRKGRIAFLMLPLVIFIFSGPLRLLLVESIVDGIREEALHWFERNQRLDVVHVIFKSIPNIISPFLWFLSLLLIFKQDKPKPEDLPTPS